MVEGLARNEIVFSQDEKPVRSTVRSPCSTALENGVVPGFAGIQARVRGPRGAAVAEGRIDAGERARLYAYAVAFFGYGGDPRTLEPAIYFGRWPAEFGGTCAGTGSSEVIAAVPVDRAWIVESLYLVYDYNSSGSQSVILD